MALTLVWKMLPNYLKYRPGRCQQVQVHHLSRCNFKKAALAEDENLLFGGVSFVSMFGHTCKFSSK